MNFLDLLKLLSSVGPKLKDIWPHVLAILAAVKAIQGALLPAGEATDAAGTLSVYSPTTAEREELDAIADALGGPTASVDLMPLLDFAGLLGRFGGSALGMIVLQFLQRLLKGE